MSETRSRWAKLWEFLQGSPARVTRSLTIPDANVLDSGNAPARFEPGAHYFAVSVNEMFLTRARQWLDVYDPMALVVSEFTYDGETRVVPFVVGPSFIEKNLRAVPNGMAITDTLVAGVHPYMGGKLALTVVLARVKRESYAKRLLQIVESVATAFPAGRELEPHLKVADAVIEGVEALFGMKETSAIVGHRWEYNDGVSPWLKPGFFALVDSDSATLTPDNLGVVQGRLRQGVGETAPEFRSNDFLLYSLRPLEARTDVSALPLYRTFNKVLRDAGNNDERSWGRAKAALVTLYQEMLTSPDLTWVQVQQLMDEFTQKTQDAHKRAASFNMLSGPGANPSHSFPAPAIASFRGEEARQRLQRLQDLHQLLDLP